MPTRTSPSCPWELLRRSRPALVAALFLLTPPRLVRATSVLPISDQELFRRADVVVHGVVVSSDVTVDDLGRPETLTVIEPLAVIKGRLSGSLALHQLGGILPDGRALQLWGRPEYLAGREAVVFAISRPEGEYQTAEMLLGKFDVLSDDNGTRFAVPELVSGSQIGVDVRKAPANREPADGEGSRAAQASRSERDDSLSSLDGPRDLTLFLEALALGESSRSSAARPAGKLAPVKHDRDRSGRRIPQWGNINNQLWRWNNNATAVWTLVNSANITGGGTAEATGALASWTNDPNSNINYTVGSGTSNTIDLNAASSGCGWSTCLSGGGVIGCGGPSGGGTNSWRGDSYITITQGFVQLRSYCTLNAFDSITTQSVLMHELGHTLGLGHSDQNVSPHDVCRGDENAATMRSSVQYRTTLGTDDQDAIRWIYGDGSNSCAPVGPPTVSGITPNFGPTAGGTSVTISGTNFQSGATVSLGGVAASGVTFVDSTTLKAVDGPHTAASVNVIVTNPDAQTGTLSSGFTYGAGVSLYTVTPCRVIDTRGADGPALAPGADRNFTITSKCGVPAGAKAIAGNVTITQPSVGGYLTAYPVGAPLPTVSAINYVSGQTRANNETLPLGATGGLAIHCGQASGTVHFILDIAGYYQ